MSTSRGDAPATGRTGRVHNRYRYILLLAPFIGTLWVPFYARHKPELWGIPFFYWYQFLWVILGVAITSIVYVLTTAPDEPRRGGNGRGRGPYDAGTPSAPMREGSRR